METFSTLLAICAGNSPVTGEFSTQRPVTRSFDVFFDLRLNNGWVNNREAGDLRRYRAHYDVTAQLRITGILWGEPAYLCNGNSYTGETSLWWNGPNCEQHLSQKL